MELFLLIANLVVLLIVLTLLLRRASPPDGSLQLGGRFDSLDRAAERTERAMREESLASRKEAGDAARQAREEMAAVLKSFQDTLLARSAEIAHLQKGQLDTFSQQLATLTQTNQQTLETMRKTLEERLSQLTLASGNRLVEMRDTIERKLTQFATDAGQNSALAREELTRGLKAFGDAFAARISEIAAQQKSQLDIFANNLTTLTQSNEQKLEGMRLTVEGKLTALQQDNAAKLEQMRLTVDEKLHATLEKRLGESFKIVSDRLEAVHKGLGEMQQLANGVGDLKKVLSNVKERGIWGEGQLGNLLAQLLTSDQYAENVQVNPRSQERVEFAIRLPGRNGDCQSVWLPIDAKFPQEDYQRLVEASQQGDADGVAASAAALELRISGEAKDIHQKYICLPHTTDFAILFLPTEGLFAEVLRRPGLYDRLLRDYRVVLTGPTTLAAVLSSLQMGFRTLAIEKRSSEVWQVLGAVKTEFGKFGEVLEKVDKKLHEASNVISDAKVRKRAVERQLKEVAATPETPAPHALEAVSSPPPAAESETTMP